MAAPLGLEAAPGDRGQALALHVAAEAGVPLALRAPAADLEVRPAPPPPGLQPGGGGGRRRPSTLPRGGGSSVLRRGWGGDVCPTHYPFGPVGLPLAPSDGPRARLYPLVAPGGAQTKPAEGAMPAMCPSGEGLR